MKKCLFAALMLFPALISCAQVFDSAVRYRYSAPTFDVAMDTLIIRAATDPTDTTEGGYLSSLQRWKDFAGGRIANDVSAGSDMYAPYSVAMASYMSSLSSSCSGSGYSGSWNCVGPFTSSWGNYDDGYSPYCERQGRINSLWVSPYDTSIILAGSDEGGLWRTNDAGLHWHNITDGNTISGTMGVNCIAVDPLDTNIIYLSVGMSNYQYGRSGAANADGGGYQFGLVYSTDGGATWNQDAGFNSIVGASTIATGQVWKCAYQPGTDRLFVIYDNKVLCKFTSSSLWTDLTPPCFSGRRRCWDMQFTNQSPIRPVISMSAWTDPASSTDSSALWIYDPATGNWTDLQLIIPPYVSGGTTTNYYQADGEGPVRFSISSNDTAFIEFGARVGSHSGTLKTVLLNTHLGAVNLNWITNSFPGAITQFQVSPAKSSVMYAVIYGGSNVGMQKSTNRGKNWSSFYSHADGRCLFIQSASTTDIADVVYFGTDGGLRKKRAYSVSQSITGEGLAITEFFGLGNTEADKDVMVGAAQDNGGLSYIKSRPEPWLSDAAITADGFNAKMMHDQADSAIEENNTGSPYHVYQWCLSCSPTTASDLPNTPNEPSGAYRPLRFNYGDTAFVGYQHIWYKAPNSGWWLSYFPLGTEPKDFPNTPQNVFDFYINERNSDTAYIAYGGAAGTNPLATVNDGKLFYSYNARSASPSWTNITPAQVQYDRINTICVDPKNSSRIWVGLGDVNYGSVSTAPGSMTDRVKYSSDFGAHWTDVSTGLPPLPVNKLLYRKGSNDEIYAGTDVGIFKWNAATNQWDCFNTGIPTCIVMDMEINYCAGKLRAATFGRGIWETDLSSNIQDNPSMIISSSQTWTGGTYYIEGGIDVLAGATLTINSSTVRMPKNGVIAVEAGGKLVIDRSTITNDCEGLWKGIQARGHTYQPQTAANQGWVVIKNGSVIENADTAVSNFDLGVGFGSTGGVMQATGSYFINNHNDVTFLAYDNYDPGTGMLAGNLSYFRNCSFLLDNNYRGNAIGYTMNHMVYMAGNEGVILQGCQFVNRDATQDRLGYGIYAWNSGFTVSPYCPGMSTPSSCPGLIRSRFCGLINGISTMGTLGYDPGTSIDQADFDSVAVGVNAKNIDNVSVSNSTFIVGHGREATGMPFNFYGSCYQNIGILYMNPSLLRIERNTFTGIPTGITNWANYGTVAGETGGNWNKIQLNSYASLDFGVYAAGINRSSTVGAISGLQVLCNNFTTTAHDIYVVSDGSVRLSAFEGIAPDQATPSTGMTPNSAGNTFSTVLPRVGVSNYCSSYFDYHCQTSVLAEHPTVAPSLLAVPVMGAGANTCTSTLPGGGGSASMALASTETIDASTLAGYKASFLAHKTFLAGNMGTYTSHVDGGNTNAMILAIDGGTDTTTLLSMLAGVSPYNSIRALEEVANTGALPHTSMLGLLKQNPDDLREEWFLSQLQSAYSFSTAEMDTLRARAADSTERTALEISIRNTSNAMGDEANIIMMALKAPSDTNVSITDTTGAGICTDSTSIYYMLDSNSYYRGFDSIDVWLQNIGGIWAQYARLQYNNFRGNRAAADGIYSAIGSMIRTPADSDLYRTYGVVWSALKSAEDDGRDIYRLSSAEVATLDTTSAVMSYDASVMMSGLWLTYQPSVYAAPTPCMSSSTSSSKPGEQYQSQSTADDKVNRFVAYPNPTSGGVTFAYNVTNGTGDVRIAVTNVFGALVMERHTGNDRGSISWDTGSISSGVYIYSATNSKGVVAKGKIVVVR